jgi:hypothetical protein
MNRLVFIGAVLGSLVLACASTDVTCRDVAGPVGLTDRQNVTYAAFTVEETPNDLR